MSTTDPNPAVRTDLAPSAGGPPGGTEQAKAVASSAAEQGKAVARQASEGAGEVVREAQQGAGEVFRTTTDEARRMAGEAGRELRHQGDAQAQRLEQALRDFGGQLRGAARGEPLPEGRGRDLAQQAGSALTGWADRLADGGVDGVLRDVSSFARRRPGLFLAGAAAVGFVAGRTFRGMQGASSAAPEPPSDTSLSGSMPAAAGLPAGGVAELGDSTVPLGGA